MAYTDADRHIDLIAALLTIATYVGTERGDASHLVDIWLDLRAAVSEEILKTDN